MSQQTDLWGANIERSYATWQALSKEKGFWLDQIFRQIAQSTVYQKFHLWTASTGSQNLMLICQILLVEFKLNEKTFQDRGLILDTAFYQGEFSFLSVSLPHNKADTQAYQRHSSTQSCDSPAEPRAQHTVWAWRSSDSHLVNESTSTSAANLRGGVLACLTAFLSLPPSRLPCLPVPSSTTPSYPLWLSYTGLPGSTMAHCGLPSSGAVHGGGDGAALPFWPPEPNKECRDTSRTKSRGGRCCWWCHRLQTTQQTTVRWIFIWVKQICYS